MNTRYFFLITVLALFCLAPPLLSAEITDINPAQNALNVPTNIEITATFDSDINPATINNQTFLIHGNYTGLLDGAYSYDSPTRTARFIPTRALHNGENVVAQLTTGVETSGGTPLDHSFIWTFTVTASPYSTGTLTLDSTYSVSGRPAAVATADLDGDGDIDIVSSSGTSTVILVMLNEGYGTFLPPVPYSAAPTQNIGSVTTSDLNNDGRVDLICLSDEGGMFIMLNAGMGAFPSSASYTVGEFPSRAVAADFDGDGYNDIAVIMRRINRTTNLVITYRNNGDGSLASPDTCVVDADPTIAAAADLDKDGDLDLAVACSEANNVAVLRNNGDGSFASYVAYPAGSFCAWVECADVHNDGNIDLVTANLNDDNISVIRNYSNGTFASGMTFPVGDIPVCVRAADFNGDGYLDLPAISVIPGSMEMLFNDDYGSFYQRQSYPLSYGLSMLAPADLNYDGAMDIVGCNIEEAKIYVLLNGHPPCCGLYTGGVTGNTDCDTEGKMALGDVTRLIDRIYLTKNPLCCEANGNVDGDLDSKMSLSDITLLIDHIYLTKQPTAACP